MTVSTAQPPNEVTIDGLRYRRIDRVADRVSPWVMYDRHCFRPLKGTTVEELVADWQREVDEPDPGYGRPMLCPVIVLEGDKECRRVGKMVFPDHPKKAIGLGGTLAEWIKAVKADADICRLLPEARRT